MKVYIGADHAGFDLKAKLIDHITKLGYEVEDEGDKRLDTNDDFPQFASRVVHAMKASGDSEPRGILICGSGQGMCMAANRHKGIRAVLGYDKESVRSARNDDDANVLCLPARVLKDADADTLVGLFLRTPFANAARYNRRIKELDDM